ncbi:hypothetical protein C8R44DRAFT_809957 [Mycena epipterygia]|nr:hypothetical protein C8R44DRAFT_809957 [Mycena epipterygia]
MACVASPSAWAHSLPYAPHQMQMQMPLRPASATWNAKFPQGLDLDLSISSLPLPAPTPAARPSKQQRPSLRLALSSSSVDALPSRRFDPFADEPIASTSQNTPPAQPRGRAPTPTAAPSPSPAPAQPIVGRRRAPSFSAGSGSPRCLASPSLFLSPAPRAQTPAPAPAPLVPLAPTPFHARHYPTPDARARLLARTLLNRIHAVGRPRSLYSCSSYSRSKSPSLGNGYENECGSRGYVPSRLSECIVAC